MTSQKKIEANRRNAQNSTGPKTHEGKRRSRDNAVTHGFFTSNRTIAGENPNDYNELRERLVDDLTPQSAIEDMLVDQILGDMWRLRRLEMAERAYFDRRQESVADIVAGAAGLQPVGGPRIGQSLLQSLLPGKPEIAYATLEQMRRSLVRDIMKQYESLREIQGENLIVAQREEETSTAPREEKSTLAPTTKGETKIQPAVESAVNPASAATSDSAPASAPRRPISRRVAKI